MERLKMMINLATASPTQLALAEFLATGGYDHHLRTIRRIYSRNVSVMTDLIARHFPAGTSMSRPRGGFMIWVEMPPGTDSLSLYQRAAAEGIGITPGPIFSLTGKFRNYIRLSAAYIDESVEKAIERLGELAGENRC